MNKTDRSLNLSTIIYEKKSDIQTRIAKSENSLKTN